MGEGVSKGRKIKLDLWEHTDGPPMGQETSLVVGDDGDEAAVASIVAAKKIEIAAAGLHHATVVEQQALEHTQTANLAEETATTAAKIASIAAKRVQTTFKSATAREERLKDEKNKLQIKLEEATAAIEMAAKNDTAALGKKAQHMKNLLTINEDDLKQVKHTLDTARYHKKSAKVEVESTFEAQQRAHLDVVVDAVKLRHAKHNVLHARFMELKSKGLKTLSAAKAVKENAHKAYKQSKAMIRDSKKTLEVLTTGAAEKGAKATVKKYQKASVKAKKVWDDSLVKVNEAKSAVHGAELAWTKRVAYKDVMKSAKLGAKADKADKDFQTAITTADKIAKAATAAAAKKALEKANAEAEKAQASVEHMKFKLKAENLARKNADDEIKEQMKAAVALAKKQKDEEAQDKSALAGVGKP